MSGWGVKGACPLGGARNETGRAEVRGPTANMSAYNMRVYI